MDNSRRQIRFNRGSYSINLKFNYCIRYCCNLPDNEEADWMQDVKGKDQILSQVVAILQENNVQQSVINEVKDLQKGKEILSQVIAFLQVNNVQLPVINQIMHLRRGVGKYKDIRTKVKPGLQLVGSRTSLRVIG